MNLSVHRTDTLYYAAPIRRCLSALISPLLMLATLAFTSGNATAVIMPTGDVTPAYAGADPWDLGTNDIHVGNTGSGSLLIDSASVVNNASGHVGYLTGSSGTVVISDAGSAWINAGDLYIGQQGTATLTIKNGGTIRNAIANLGSNNNTTVNATITDADSAWYCTGRMNVGLSGTCIVTLNVENGARVESPSGLVGASSISTGIANITGDGSSWINSSVMTLGLSGNGTLNITDGGLVRNTGATFANSVSATGAANVSGLGSRWENAGTMTIGRYGVGTLSIEDAGKVTADAAVLGFYNSTGTATVTGTGSRWDIAGNLDVGYGGVGTLHIADGGTISVGNNLNISTYAFASGTVNLTGGTLDLNGSNIIAGEGAAAFNFTAGTLKNAANIDLKQPLTQSGGTLAPGGSIGQTNILGDYQLNAGTLEVELGGLDNPHDLLSVTGNINIADLGTSLDLQAIGLMHAGTYTLIQTTAGTITGTFEHITGLGLQPGLIEIHYDPTSVTITLNQDLVPEPGMLILLLVGGVCAAARRQPR